MKDVFKKVLVVTLLFVTVITSGCFVNLNPEVEAAQATIKPCSHTTIKTNCSGKYNTAHSVEVVTKQGTYKHTHTHRWAYNAKTGKKI